MVFAKQYRKPVVKTSPHSPHVPMSRRRTLLKAGGLAALASLVACSGSGSPEASARALVGALEDHVRERQQRESVPGISFVVATRDAVVHAAGFGVTRAGGTEAVTADTVFQIGSTTKAFLSATLAMAVDDGVLGWDDTLMSLEPAFRLSDPGVAARVTPADVLAHVTGLPHYVYDAMWVLGYPMASRLRALASVPLSARYRTTSQYVNILHALVGSVIARRAGTASWEDYLQARLLGPLGMARSSVTQAAFYGAVGHAWGHQPQAAGPTPIDLVGRYWYGEGVGPGGGINSTANDMGRWLRLQLGRGAVDGRRLVSTASLERTWQPLVSELGTGSALGWGVVQLPQGRLISHDGGTASFGSNVMLLPEQGVGIAVLSNHSQEGLPFALSRWFAARYLGETTSDPRARFVRPAPTPEVPLHPLARPASAYELAFRCDTLGPGTVRAEALILVLTLQEVGAQFRLRPVGPDQFLADLQPQGRFGEAVSEGFNPFFAMQFSFDAAGRVTGVELSSASGSGYDTHSLRPA